MRAPKENTVGEKALDAMETTLKLECSFGFKELPPEWQEGLKRYAMTQPHPQGTTRVLIVASDNARLGQPGSAIGFYHQLVYYNGSDVLGCTAVMWQSYWPNS